MPVLLCRGAGMTATVPTSRSSKANRVILTLRDQRRPSGENTHAIDSAVWPSSVRKSLPLLVSPTALPCCQNSRWPACRLRMKCHAEDGVLVAFERAEQLAASRMSKALPLVNTPAGQHVTPCGSNAKLMTKLLGDLRACAAPCRCALPEFYVESSLPLTRVSPRDKSHTSYMLVVAFKRAQQFATAHFPELHRFVITPAGQRRARGSKATLVDVILVPSERAQQLAAAVSHSFTVIVVTPAGQHVARRIKSQTLTITPMALQTAQQRHAQRQFGLHFSRYLELFVFSESF